MSLAPSWVAVAVVVSGALVAAACGGGDPGPPPQADAAGSTDGAGTGTDGSDGGEGSATAGPNGDADAPGTTATPGDSDDSDGGGSDDADGGSGDSDGGGSDDADGADGGSDDRPTGDDDGSPAPAGPAATVDGDPLVCWSAPTSGEAGEISFDDVTERAGLVDPLAGMHGHAAAFGDVNGDGAVDLVVGTFADRPPDNYRYRGADGPSPDRLLLGDGDSFTVTGDLDGELGRTSGAAFADLDGDGDLDLVLARNPRDGDRNKRLPSAVYENVDGTFREVDGAGIDPELGGRSIGVLDYDRDGLLDLYVVEDEWQGGSSRLYRNTGDLRFDDVTRDAGLPTDVHGLGVVTVDLNADRMTDLFVSGSNRLFVADGDGFYEADASVFEWDLPGAEDDVAGADAADVNRDGRPDLVVGQHFNSTVDSDETEPVRLYLNTTSTAGGEPTFVDVTDDAGLVGLPTKAPHVAFADLDNDGWFDIVTSASADDGARPAVFRHRGLDDDGTPRFERPDGLGSDQYWVMAPVADVNRDGRLDVLLVEWEPALGSVLLESTGSAGHWLAVSVDASLGGGPGTVVWVYEAGRGGDPDALVARREITLSAGYAAGHEAVAHFGLGERESVDVVVETVDGRRLEVGGATADRHLRLPDGCS